MAGIDNTNRPGPDLFRDQLRCKGKKRPHREGVRSDRFSGFVIVGSSVRLAIGVAPAGRLACFRLFVHEGCSFVHATLGWDGHYSCRTRCRSTHATKDLLEITLRPDQLIVRARVQNACTQLFSVFCTCSLTHVHFEDDSSQRKPDRPRPLAWPVRAIQPPSCPAAMGRECGMGGLYGAMIT